MDIQELYVLKLPKKKCLMNKMLYHQYTQYKLSTERYNVLKDLLEIVKKIES